MKMGRRRALFISCFFGVAGVCITYHMSLTNFIVGRVLYGVSAGLFSSIGPRY